MAFNPIVNARIAQRWNGSSFVEENLTISGADGIAVLVDSVGFTVSGNEAAVLAEIAALSGTIASDIATLSGNLAAEIDSDIATYSGFAEGQFVNEAGDTMTGFLTLVGDPTNTNHAANKNYVDAELASASGVLQTDINSRVLRAGDTMTGFLTLNADPTAALHAATKQYVDDQVASGIDAAAVSVQENGGSTISGVQTINFLDSLDVIDQGGGVIAVVVDETEFQNVVFTSGNQIVGGDKTFEDNIVIEGDLTVQGNTTTLDTTELLVEDNIVTLNSTFSGSPVLDAGIEIERGSSDNAQLLWDESLDRWVAGISGAFVGDDGVIVLRSELEAVESDVSSLSGTLQSDIDSRVLRAGDTMTGFLTLSADPTAALHAATKQYVDDQVASGVAAANIAVEDDGASVGTAVQVLDFGNGLDATLSGSDEVLLTVNEAELTTLMHLAGEETATGKKTFGAGLAVSSGIAPSDSNDTQAGIAGEIRWSDDYIFIYNGTVWKRTALAQF